MPLTSQPLAAFVPHDLKASISGAATGPLAGLVGAVKDMYDIAGYRTGGGSPDWLAAASEATASAAAVRRILDAGAKSDCCQSSSGGDDRTNHRYEQLRRRQEHQRFHNHQRSDH